MKLMLSVDISLSLFPPPPPSTQPWNGPVLICISCLRVAAWSSRGVCVDGGVFRGRSVCGHMSRERDGPDSECGVDCELIQSCSVLILSLPQTAAHPCSATTWNRWDFFILLFVFIIHKYTETVLFCQFFYWWSHQMCLHSCSSCLFHVFDAKFVPHIAVIETFNSCLPLIQRNSGLCLCIFLECRKKAVFPKCHHFKCCKFVELKLDLNYVFRL